jgi:LysM repeat protein
MNARRLLLYLILNVIVSATTVLSVLWLWERMRPAPLATAPAPTVLPLTPVALVPSSAAPTQAGSPAPPPSPTPTLHVVQFGDTLGSIAQQYDVPVADIMAANGLTDPNVLSIGQTLVIPVGGLVPTGAPTESSSPPIPTATRDPNAPLPKLSIREVQAPGVLSAETLVVLNSGGPVDLAGWTLRDDAGHIYTFPSLTLFADGAVNVHTAAGDDTVIDLYWNQPEAVWASGKVVLLSDPNGNLQARFTAP